jgi:hypothetical protein
MQYDTDQLKEEILGLRARWDGLVELIQSFADAYPEDMFEPLPDPKTETDEMRSYRTRASAGMGRHISRVLLEKIGKDPNAGNI